MKIRFRIAVGIAVLAMISGTPALAQYNNPYFNQPSNRQMPTYLDDIPDWQIEKYLSKWKVTGVRPSREAYLAVRYYGVHARLIINHFGEDGLAALSRVSGASAIALRNLMPELKQLPQVSAVLRLIADHAEPDRIVQLLVSYRSELVDTPFVDVLLQKPDAVLDLGPMAQMHEIVALYDDPAVTTRAAGSPPWLVNWPQLSSINFEGWTKEQIEMILYGGLLSGIAVAIVIQARRKLMNGTPRQRTVAQPAPRLTYNGGRPTPAFMQRRGSQSS